MNFTALLAFFVLLNNAVRAAPVDHTLSIQAPAANATFVVGQSAEIAWTSTDNSPIDIDLISADNNNISLSIAQQLSAGLGTYLWKVPYDLSGNSTSWKVSIKHHDEISLSGEFYISSTAPIVWKPSATVAQAMASTTAIASISIVSSSSPHADSAASPLACKTTFGVVLLVLLSCYLF
ncbi:hypothetical protein DFQ28_002177 [Apophysomyces sp. BC1034]|nr:hypothetical protein DFQ29_007744 [Apophysomyces sp. BC1021]KAG0190362.1 hypothetical protein DFQ28_002177 [Apophysomyces sp. BC1034]